MSEQEPIFSKQDPLFIPIISIPALSAGFPSYDLPELHKKYWLHGPDSKIHSPSVQPLTHGKLIVLVRIRPENKVVQTAEEKNKKIIPSGWIRALIATGAKKSSIKQGHFQYLKIKSFKGLDKDAYWNLLPKPERNINASINIEGVMPDDNFLDICPVVGKWHSDEYNFIIGWDILQYCVLNYNGLKSEFTLEFIGKK